MAEKPVGWLRNMKIETVKEYFAQTEEDESECREHWLDDLRFGLADDQWPEKLRRLREDDGDGPRPCLTVNKIPVHGRQIINDMRQNRAGIKVLPVDDEADVETAEVLQGMIRHIEHISNAQMAYDIAAEYQVFMGMGYFRIDTIEVDPLYNYQDIIVRPIRNPFTVYFDAWVEDHAGADAKRCFVADTMNKKQYEAEYPDAKDINWTMSGRGDGWITEDRIRVAEHYWIEDADTDYVMVDGNWMKAEKFSQSGIDAVVEQMQTIKEPRLHWQIMNGEGFIDGGETGLVKPGRYIPIIRVPGEDFYIEDKRMVCGIVRRARDAQRLYNYSVSVNAEVNALQPKSPWLVAEEGVDGHEEDYAAANVKNLPYLKYNAFTEDGQPIPPPQRQFPSGVNAGYVNMMQLSDGDLQATIGQFAASLGAPSNEKSGIAIQSRQRVGDIATYHYPDNMAHAIRHAGRVIIDLVPHYYDTKRVARILGEDGKAETITLSPGEAGETIDAAGKKTRIYDVGIGKYDVAVTVGPSYNTKRQDAFESMAQMTQANPQLWGIIGDLLVNNMDWPGADEMAKRMRATIPPEILQDEENGEPMDPEVAAQFQQMEQAFQQIQEQLQGVTQENAQLNEVIQGKVIEKDMKAAESEVKMAELDQKNQELALKRDEAVEKLSQTAQKQETEFEAMAMLVQTAAGSAEQTQQLMAQLAVSTQQNGEMLAAMLQQMAMPRAMNIETDEQGNIIGGTSVAVEAVMN